MAPRGRGKRGGGRAAKKASNRPTPRGDSQTSNRTTPTGPGESQTSNRGRPTGLPSQYTFTPANPQATESQRSPVPIIQPPAVPTFRDYPPPMNLFQTARSYPGTFHAGEARIGSPLPQPRGSPSPQPRVSPSPQPGASESHQPRASASHHPGHSPPQSSQAQNSHEEEDEEDALREPTLAEDVLAGLQELLVQPGRELYTTVLSPTLEPGTTWFGKDKSALTRKITKVFTNKFDGAYYSWSCVPVTRRERYFLEFAKQHTWHPSLTGVVQAKFYKICQIRIKDMVSKAGSQREQPNWIDDTLWKEMCDYWDTEEARTKSETTSAARMSDRNGHGPHKHVSGQKSFLQVEQELEVELGRPPTIGEVFIRTHTKKDGTFVDKKAQEVHEAYKKKKEAKLAELENDEISDGTSRRSQLSLEEDDELFLQSTFTNDRGQIYGVGSLGSYINGKRKYPGSSSSFKSLRQQLEEANLKIEKQAALQAEHEAENSRVAAEQQAEIKHLTIVKKYLSATDPNFLTFLDSQSNDPATDAV